MSNDRTDTVGVDDLVAWLRRSDELITENAAYLTDLDAAIGDADHGSNMKRGLAAVVKALDDGEFETVDALMKKVGSTLVSAVGGASGPLYGTFFLRFGTSQKEQTELDASQLHAALRAGVEGIEQRGKATIGEKTMLDAWVPALDAYAEQDDGLAGKVFAGARAAAAGRDATADLVATKGRASYLGDRSVGHIDPGAASTALLWRAMAEALGVVPEGSTELA
ncbi:MAG: dihydroxyacetone kinase subunit DhaL [Brachybacterium sp.]|nr:dihydroxyacetone kinase subunit DhaL [Brachybacterium sp.]